MNSDNPFDPANSATDELPDFLRLQKMAPTRMNLLEWRQNGLEQRLGELEARAGWFPIATGNDSAELAESIVDSCFPPDVIPPWNKEQSLGILKEISYEQGCHDDRLNSLETSIAALDGMQSTIDRLTARIDELESKTPC